ncbi:hypothetical protein J3E74DRAFT_409674 [Bipolaris maydis]|nr:hypothetical protein J3E74DRAFT_409674 [Bipolaris maydis]
MSTFAMLIPLTVTSYSTTLLQPNLRYVQSEPSTCQFDQTAVKSRAIHLSFGALLGRRCFSFGSSRSNEYQLPASDEVAPHHFIVYFDLEDNTLYIRSTCLQGITVYSDVDRSHYEAACDIPIAITASIRIRIGTTGRFLFKVVNVTHLDPQRYTTELEDYSRSLLQSSIPLASITRRSEGKRRVSDVDVSGTERVAKRHRGITQTTDATIQFSSDESKALNEDVRLTRNSKVEQQRMLIPFDIKSSVGASAEDQVYATATNQQARTGIYIAVCASNPGYVEVYPNRFSSLSRPDIRKVAVNLSRKSHLPPSSYGFLSPCNSAYRMPIAMLKQALESLRRCAQGQGDYVNPWTGVQFPEWRPHIEHGNETLMPSENSQHYTSFKGVIEIWRCVRVAGSQYDVPIGFELIGLQPRLTDFKFLVPGSQGSQRRQVFVQYKIDGVYRSPTSPLTKVAIARNQRRGHMQYYFTECERFDFLFYEFNYQDHRRKAWTSFFFLPERVIPDEFYLTQAKEADFSRSEFMPYWVEMDMAGLWVKRVFDIIQATPHPRQSAKRPSRPLEATEKPATIQSHLPLQPQAFTAMEEKEAFLTNRVVPCTITQLPRTAVAVPFLVYTKARESTSRGPTLTVSEFARLDMCPQRRLLIFDSFGQDGQNLYGPLLAVPSDDISLIAQQYTTFKSNREKDKDEEFEGRVPLLAELLHTGLSPVDYAIATSGPFVFDRVNP